MTYQADYVTSSVVVIVRRMRRQCDLRDLLTSKCPHKEAILGRNHYSQGKRMREIAKKQKAEDKKQRKEARQNPQPEENAEAAVTADMPAVDVPIVEQQ
jgi:hypothetical protein